MKFSPCNSLVLLMIKLRKKMLKTAELPEKKEII
jgi:hypothetical protein